jgi:hypothetical protein
MVQTGKVRPLSQKLALALLPLFPLFAGATQLEEAIKSAQLSGLLQIKFHNYTRIKDTAGNKVEYNGWERHAHLKFGLPVDENLKFYWQFASDGVDYSKSIVSGDQPYWGDNSTGDANLVTQLLYFDYHNSYGGVTAGKMPVKTPITSGDPVWINYGVGTAVYLKPAEGLTISAGWVDKLFGAKGPTDIMTAYDEVVYVDTDQNFDKTGDPTAIGDTAIDDDIFWGAIQYTGENWKGEVWYFNLPHVIQYEWVARVSGEYQVSFGKLKGGVDFAQSRLDNHLYWVYNPGDYENGNFMILTDTSEADATAAGKEIVNDWKPKNYFHIYAGLDTDRWGGKVGYARTTDRTGFLSLDPYSPLNDIFGTEQIKGLTNMGSYHGGFGIALYSNLYYRWSSQFKNYFNIVRIKEGGTFIAVEWKIGATYRYNKRVEMGAYFDNTNYGAMARTPGPTGNNPANVQEWEAEVTYRF